MTILPKKKVAKEKGDSENSQYHHRLHNHHHSRHGIPSVASVPVSSHPPWHQYTTTASSQIPSRRHLYSQVAIPQVTSSIPGNSEMNYGLHWTPDRLSPEGPCSNNGGIMKRKRRRDPLANSTASFCKSVLSTNVDNTNIVKQCNMRPVDRVPSEHETSGYNLENQSRKSPDGSACATSGSVASPPHNNSEDEYENSNEVTDPERELRFERLLKSKKGFLVKKMREDGACMFRAISDQIYGDQDMHSIIRNHVCDYMLKNRDYFQHYVTEDFTRYIERKRVDSAHGNHVELQAISEMYNRPIEIYIYDAEPAKVTQCSYGTDNPPIRLSYHNNQHYNSVSDPFAATVGVGLGLPSFNPGLAEKTMMKDALGASENFFIEQAMYEDKLRATDWEATNDAISEAVIRESRLQFHRDQEKQRALNLSPKQSRSPTYMGAMQSEYATQQGSKQQQLQPQYILTSETATRSKPSSPAHSPAPSNLTADCLTVTSASCCSSGECAQPRGRQSPVATRCSVGMTGNSSPRTSNGQLSPQTGSTAQSSLAADEMSHTPLVGFNSPPFYYVSDCQTVLPQDPSNQEYLLMRALTESQLDYYNNLRYQPDVSSGPGTTSPKPGPSSAAS